ncbi:hypothetical protein H5410_020231 [Solanum commersonii]|uniref:Uncharacterized protein n=1 Tax=Solanum commersonii TaxID=4109 RepID=A0A9J5ZDK6_SOLCO|nr:hypothetical protein H5410_020231 [Solanum commersonii]
MVVNGSNRQKMMLKSSLWLPCKKNIQQKSGGGFWHEKNETALDSTPTHYTRNTTRKEERIQKKMKNLGLIKAMATHSTL